MKERIERILTIDLSKLEITETAVDEKYNLSGGRGLTAKILSAELDPQTDPLSSDNMLLFAPGLLAGYPLSSANRLSVGSKSPLTGGIKESNSGGTGAYNLARLGIRLPKLKGSIGDETLRGIVITMDGAEIIDLPSLKGFGTYETTRQLQKRYGAKITVFSIGPAGEKMYPAAAICATNMEGEPCRVLARGGLGTVMGSKGLKALIVDTSGAPAMERNPGLSDLIKSFAGALRENPVTGDLFPKFGTSMTLGNVNALGGLPTRNFSSGVYEKADCINAEALRNTILQRGGNPTHACMPGCVIRCSNKYVREDGSPLVGSIEYETICLPGSNLDISIFDTVARLNYLCNDIGIDTMEIGAAMGVLSDAGVLEFGNDEKYINAVESIAHSSDEIGPLPARGAVECGRVTGVRRVPAVKGQSMAAYDPRVIKGMGLTYGLSPMGADHTAGNAITLNIDHNDVHSLVEPVFDLNIKYYILDTLGLCLFTGRVSLADPDFIGRFVSEITGIPTRFETLYEQAKGDLRLELVFNKKAGLTAESDRIPDFMKEEKLEPNGTIFNVPDSEFRRFYDGLYGG